MKRLLAVSLLIAAIALTGCQREENAPITAPPGQGMPPGGIGGPGPVQMNKEIETLKSILQKDPDNLRTLINLGNAYYDIDRYPDAIVMYERALKIDPTNNNVRVDMGISYRRSGKPDIAEKTFRETLEIDPRHPYGNMNLGVVLAFDFSKFDEAIPYFEKYLELAPGAQNTEQIRQIISDLKVKSAQKKQIEAQQSSTSK